MTSPRVLFISHSASRNGASILLLNFIRWLRPRVRWHIEVLVLGPGPLVEEYRSLATTHVLRNAGGFLAAAPTKWRQLLERRVEATALRVLLAGRRYDAIYANTAAVWRQLSAIRSDAKVLWHIHELSYGLKVSLAGACARPFERASIVVAVSDAVRQVLQSAHGVPHELIEVIHEFVPVRQEGAILRYEARRRLLQHLAWPEDAFVVGGCGALGWRKGTDLFIQIAKMLAGRDPNGTARFLWVGGSQAGNDALEFEHDVRWSGLDTRCVRIPSSGAVDDFYSAMDVFALTSREDPFPLVMLEAGVKGVPTVCFEGSGGGPEYVQNDAGLVVPRLDVSAFADRLCRLQGNPDLRHTLGETARRKVLGSYSEDVQAPKLLAALQSLVV